MSICIDCDTDTAPCTGKRGCRHAGKWEYYMVSDEVWLEAMNREANPWSGFLCIGCLERRIGRRLLPEDFTGANINEPDPWDTERLTARKRGDIDPRTPKGCPITPSPSHAETGECWASVEVRADRAKSGRPNEAP